MKQQFPGQIQQTTAPLQGTNLQGGVQHVYPPSSGFSNITETRGTTNLTGQPLTTGLPTTTMGQQTGLMQGQQTGYVSGQQVLPSHHRVGTTGVGTVTFRPIEGRFMKDKDIIGKMDPYCKFKIGWRSGKSSVAKGQGLNAIWAGDAITLKVKNHEFAKLKVKDKDRLRPDDRIGSAEIPLAQLIQQGTTKQWISITKGNQVTGEVLIEMTFSPTAGSTLTNTGVTSI